MKKMSLNDWSRPITRSGKVRAPTNLVYIVVAVLGVGVLVTLVNIYELRRVQDLHGSHASPVVEGLSGKSVLGVRQPVVWVNGKRLTSGYLKHVFNVFERLGYEIRLGKSANDWDVMWSHDYPFTKLAKPLGNLRAHQKVNHFPGSGYITMKVSLATSKNPFIPQAFKMPSDKAKLLKYMEAHPGKLWVQKSNDHRGIQIKTMQQLDLSASGTFIQEYVDKPFLIDGRKFDIGIYAVLTSVNPLRAYTVDGDALFRFCPKDYLPFDAADVDKYVVGDDYTPMWQMPSLAKLYTERKLTFKETFNAYLRMKGKDDRKLWSDLESCIRQVYLEKESLIFKAARAKYRSTKYFFEMVRFDFVLDEDLNIYLMEVNMSPNLSSGHFPPNKRLYEHVIYNLLGLVGIGKKNTNSFFQSFDDEADMLASTSDISTFGDVCVSTTCDSCSSQKCKLCDHCLKEEDREMLKMAYQEHVNRGTCGRVFPKPMTQEDAFNWETCELFSDMNSLSLANRLMTLWFIGKCQQDRKWCS